LIVLDGHHREGGGFGRRLLFLLGRSCRFKGGCEIKGTEPAGGREVAKLRVLRLED